MKLSRLYSNQPALFEPINFTTGLNVVLAEIRLPENKKKDTHNLGKTTLGRLLDFCLLSKRSPNFFLFKHLDLFKGFAFFLEIELLDGSFVTVQRTVKQATKISFKKHLVGKQDFTFLPRTHWDHVEVPFEKGKELLDGLLDLSGLKPWTYRKSLGFLLRTQADFRDVFQLQKFSSSKHIDWKPYLAHILGFNAALPESYYEKQAELSIHDARTATIEQALGGSIEDISKIEGMLLLKRKDAEKKQNLLDAFDFGASDKDKTKQLVEDLNERIAQLNARRYSLNQNKHKIRAALADAQILFDPADAERLFAEAGVLFAGQLKHDFEQLVDFNRAITEERHEYLLDERGEIDGELHLIGRELDDLGRRRSETLSFLSETDVFDKYKRVTDDLVNLKATIKSLENQRRSLQQLQALRSQSRLLEDEKERLRHCIEVDVEKRTTEEGLFRSILLFFNEIVEEVIDHKALLTVATNKIGHLDFKAEILDESGNTTSADLGYTYRKLLCIAFDLAVLRAHLDQRFPRFVYEDGVFESLDDRKKESLLGVLRSYTEAGLQVIITLIDSDLPPTVQDAKPVFEGSEIVLLLHDENEGGRLFKMKGW